MLSEERKKDIIEEEELRQRVISNKIKEAIEEVEFKQKIIADKAKEEITAKNLKLRKSDRQALVFFGVFVIVLIIITTVGITTSSK